MNDASEKPPVSETTPPAEAEPQADPVQSGPDPGTSSSPGSPEPPPAGGDGDPGRLLEEVRGQAAAAQERSLRIAAELENYRKRAAKDVAEASRGAKERVLRELLPVIDLLSKAAEAADKASDAHAVAEGVRMIVRQFEDVTGKMGVARVKTTGLPFDPNFHEAVSQVTVSGQPAGSVVAEVEAGYTWDGRLLRAAKVVVAAEEG